MRLCLIAFITFGLWSYLVKMIVVDGDKGIAFVPHSGCQISSVQNKEEQDAFMKCSGAKSTMLCFEMNKNTYIERFTLVTVTSKNTQLLSTKNK